MWNSFHMPVAVARRPRFNAVPRFSRSPIYPTRYTAIGIDDVGCFPLFVILYNAVYLIYGLPGSLGKELPFPWMRLNTVTERRDTSCSVVCGAVRARHNKPCHAFWCSPMNENQPMLERNDHSPRQSAKGCVLVALGGVAVFLLLVLAAAISFFNSRPLQISEETTYITEPRTADGERIDYVAAIQQARRPKNVATDENGYRLIVQHLGWDPDAGHSIGTSPDDAHAVLAEIYKVLGLSADTMQPALTHEDPRDFLRTYVASGEFDQALLEGFPQEDRSQGDFSDERIRRFAIEMLEKIVGSDLDEALLEEFLQEDPAIYRIANALQQKLVHPWTLDELPMMAQWLDENGPALDLVSRAAGKSTFHVPLVRQNKHEIIIDDVAYFEIQRMRLFARGLQARANYRIGVGDIDGAIDDIVACQRLGRHYGRGVWLVDLLV
jgi:hypothetical protein